MVKDIIQMIRNYYHVIISSLLRSDYEDLPVVEENLPIDEVFRILSTRHHVWVVDSKDSMRLIGLITEKDMIDLIAPKRLSPYTIGGIDTRSILFGKIKTAGHMANKRLITASPEDTIQNVLLKMKRYRLRRLPVVKEGRLIGEITLRLLLIEFMKALEWYRRKY